MLFSIIGGTTSGFTNMGQTWSQPVVAKVKINKESRQVLIFGGGYDTCYEDNTCGTSQQGNQLYIVDAFTGQKIWSASSSSADTIVPEMTYSMPSQPKVADFNSDGYADTIYIGDLGGQVFRVDLDNGDKSTSLVRRVKVVAQLANNSVAKDARRIYEPPSVALFKDIRINKVFAAISVGTGNRSRPLIPLLTITLLRSLTMISAVATCCIPTPKF